MERPAGEGFTHSAFMADCTSGQIAERPSVPAEVWQRCEQRIRPLSGEEK